MKTRGLEKTSTQMLTLFLSSLFLCLPTMPPPLQPPTLIFSFSLPSLTLPFCSAAFSISHLAFPSCFLSISYSSHRLSSLCPSTPSVSLVTPPLLSTPTHSWYSTDLSGQLYDRSAEKGALLNLKATLYGQQCMYHSSAVLLCVHFTGLYEREMTN